MELNSVIIKPYRTEKTYTLASYDKKTYVFVVHKNASKTSISQAFEEIYGVKPDSINVLIKKPTRIRTNTKKPGWSKLTKIAYVSLPKGVDIITSEDQEANK